VVTKINWTSRAMTIYDTGKASLLVMNLLLEGAINIGCYLPKKVSDSYENLK
jgi:hypothetical protein